MPKLTTREINVTENAKAYLKKAIGAHAGLRLSILSGKGCGGNEYSLVPLSEPSIDQHDDCLDAGDGILIYIPAKDVLKMFGSTIDYIEDHVGNRRINITNPNETGRCGCGTSVTF